LVLQHGGDDHDVTK